MHNKTKHKDTKHFCMHCLQAFSSKEFLTKHKENCLSINGIQGIQVPKKGSKVEFKDHHRQMPVPFVIYADFAAINEKVSGCQSNEEKSYTDKYQHHTGLYLEGRFKRVFCVTGLEGLYLEGLTHGGAYFRNVTVCYLTIIFDQLVGFTKTIIPLPLMASESWPLTQSPFGLEE